MTEPGRVCSCGHKRTTHVPERTGEWLHILGPNVAICRVCTCNRYRETS